MAEIHQLGIKATDTTNLLELSTILDKAVNMAIEAGVVPHLHPVVRLICHMIGFAGDGDIPSPTYYKDILDFCLENEDNETQKGKAPNEPPRKAS